MDRVDGLQEMEKTGRMGRSGQCGPFGLLFHFQCHIHLIHIVLFLSTSINSSATPLTLNFEATVAMEISGVRGSFLFVLVHFLVFRKSVR